jgi:hypothetical protein
MVRNIAASNHGPQNGVQQFTRREHPKDRRKHKQKKERVKKKKKGKMHTPKKLQGLSPRANYTE